MWQDLFGNKFLYQFIAFVCDIDCMMRNTNEQSKLKELRNVKDGSYTQNENKMRKYFLSIEIIVIINENIKVLLIYHTI